MALSENIRLDVRNTRSKWENITLTEKLSGEKNGDNVVQKLHWTENLSK